MAACRPLRWWTSEQQALVVGALQRVLVAWESDWGLQPVRPVADVVHCALACEWKGPQPAAATRWNPVPPTASGSAGLQAWWQLPARRPSGAAVGDAQEPVTILVQAIFGGSSDAPSHSLADAVADVAADTAKAAWNDLWQSIDQIQHPAARSQTASRAAVESPALQPAPAWCAPWSGAVVVTLDWCGRDLHLLIGGEAIEIFLQGQRAITPPAVAPPAPVVPVWDAVSGLAASVRAELEPVQLSLGAVKALRVGDVIELSHALDMPLLARTATGELLCEAFLGRTGEHRAIELLRTPSGAC